MKTKYPCFKKLTMKHGTCTILFTRYNTGFIVDITGEFLKHNNVMDYSDNWNEYGFKKVDFFK